jgi:TetR/AcrR family transcriptional repressor of uid operon
MADKDVKTKLRTRRGAQLARDVIIEAAASQFARKGYHGTTMEDIAAAAGYSPAAIYKYFKNKEDLFGSLWSMMALKVKGIFEESAAMDLPFLLRLRWVVTVASRLLDTSPDPLVAFLAQRPHVVRHAETALERQASKHYRAYHEQVVAFMERGVEEGALRPGSPEDYALLFMGLLQAFAYAWVISDGDFDSVENTNKLIDLFLRGAGRPDLDTPKK